MKRTSLPLHRREFISLLGGAAAWPVAARAQQGERVRRIGILASDTMSVVVDDRIAAFRQRLGELGHVEGRDVVLEIRSAEGRVARMPALAEELISLKPAVIVTGTTAAAVAAKKASTTIPIVSVLLSDPIGFGLVASHARPGGNVTGNLISLDTLPGKHLELARDVLPGAARIGMLVNALNPTNALHRRNAEGAATTINATFVPVEVHAPDQIDAAFQTLAREHIAFLIVPPDTMFFSHKEHIAALAIAARLPSIYPWREHVEAGGLISYGTDMRQNYRYAAVYVDKILRGAKPADLPVEPQTKFELVINLQTAKALGIEVPPALLARADEVIE